MPTPSETSFRVIVEKDEDGLFVASAPSLPGCRTQGKTYEEVIGRMREAIELYLEVLKEERQFEPITAKETPRFLAIEDVAVQV
ncbi:MAG: type II toxin-antitoxin system HicB family antitoxin [Patescibacteria group bacterium]